MAHLKFLLTKIWLVQMYNQQHLVKFISTIDQRIYFFSDDRIYVQYCVMRPRTTPAKSYVISNIGWVLMHPI